ncbi:NmrA family NAD(P)-binding protein [Bernardetia sp. ABR2-2B]|uniref:NmrA family NAD(P)-binding protein n=1 Tax=Bernardetia sp. ABR2-2B TaxID=3127472 RepID=UPI0030D48112
MYVITGATGNTGSEVVNRLLAAGKKVKAISRSEERLQSFVEKGAIPAVGELEDTNFLTKTFEGATAIYAVIPPKWDLQEDWRGFMRRIGNSIVEAIQKSDVKNIVVLSSNGAQLESGAGPVTGLYEFEQRLKQIEGLNITALRAGYFMQNFFGLVPMIENMGLFGYSLKSDIKTPIVHTKDIGEVAVKHLLNLDFKGFNSVFVSGAEDLTMNEVAEILGNEIGKPNLKYMQFSREDAINGMVQNGIPQTIAEGYDELFNALNEGDYLNDYKRTSENTTPTTLKDFAKNEFAHAFKHEA